MKLSTVTTILATGSLVAATPTPTHLSKRIIGGTNATIDQFPYHVSIQRRIPTFVCETSVHTCGGVIIAPNKILTAAHCALSNDDDDSGGPQFQVRAGSSYWTHGGQLVKVNNITVHPLYKPAGNRAHDIAVLTLKSNLTLGDGVAVADLAAAEDGMPGGGTDVVVAGWGQTRAGRGPPSRSLRSLKLKVALRWVCRFQYIRYGGLGSRDFCAGDWTAVKNTWVGDSGGALFDVERKKVVGLVSHGLDNPKKGVPTVFTSVAGYREYLAKVAHV